MDRHSKSVLTSTIGLLVEDLSADAVIICVTRRKKGGTETIVVPYGNMHACRGLVEYAYGHLCEGMEDEEQIDE
jgi:hypothetical protein